MKEKTNLSGRSGLLVALLFIGMSACSEDPIVVAPDPERLPSDKVESIAKEIMDDWTAGRFDEVAEKMAPPLTEFRSAEALRKKWQGSIDAHGAFQSIDGPEVSYTEYNSSVALFELRFEKTALNMKLILTPEGQIDDYFLSIRE